MKTVSQIQIKARKLKNMLIGRSYSSMCENFGEKEIDVLNDYVGFLWDYPYNQRTEIAFITLRFQQWCRNYTCGVKR